MRAKEFLIDNRSKKPIQMLFPIESPRHCNSMKAPHPCETFMFIN